MRMCVWDCEYVYKGLCVCVKEFMRMCVRVYAYVCMCLGVCV